MPDENDQQFVNETLMTAVEIEAIAKIFCQNGVNKIRLTGGEPLVRKDAADIIFRLSKLPAAITLTTNAVRVHEFIEVFKTAGVKTLNVSLDTLQEDKFKFITRRDHYKQVVQNIELLLANNFHVKLNVVVMKGVNDNEINDFIALTKNESIHVRFIEFMPFDGNKWSSNKVLSLDEILHTAALQYNFTKMPDEKNATAKKFSIQGHKGTFAVISTMTSPFCSTCNRLRLTADGKLKNCLFSTTETDLLTPYRNGENILPLITGNIEQKAAATGGQLTTDLADLSAETLTNRSMINIGG
jgi:cyclic pyranopterin phosphate synthase